MNVQIQKFLAMALLLGVGAVLPLGCSREKSGPAVNAAGQAVKGPESRDARMQWWRQDRFGMFIHWGIYAVPGDGEWFLTNHKMPLEQYARYAGQMNPVKFDADEWAKIAHDAGMKYLVITAKHHDGFCMFKTSTTKYNIVDATPWHQDPLAALSKACQRHGVRFCCYYSIMDWHNENQAPAKADPVHPVYNPTSFPSPEKKAAYIAYMKAQLKDLVTQYNPGLIWFDGGWMNGWSVQDGIQIAAYLHQLDPALIVNDRIGGAGDYGTPEQNIPAAGNGRDWETCMTINGHWGFSRNDHNFKSTELLLHNLIDIASKGGNYLLNVGPTDEGVIPAEEAQRLAEMGDWLKVNGEAIYGTTAGPFKRQLDWGRCTQRPGKLYLSVFNWPKDGSLLVPVSANVKKAYLLAHPGQTLSTTSAADGVRVAVPAVAPDSIASVIVLEIDGPVVTGGAPALTQAIDGSITLTAADADIQGSSLNLEGEPTKNLGYWVNITDYPQWMAKVKTPGIFAAQLTYSLTTDGDGTEIVVAAGDAQATAKLAATGGWSAYKTIELPALKIDKAGVVLITIKGKTKPGVGVMNFRQLTLRPKERA